MRKLSWILMLAAALVMVFAFTPASTALADGGGACPGSLASQLVVGGTGRIARTFSTLRSVPGGAAIRVMYAPGTFTVVDGPQCGNGLTHFRLDYGNGLIGWAAESQISSQWGANQYWLVPTDGGTGGPDYPTPPCAGSLPARLAVGNTGVVAQSFSTLRSSPAGPGIRIMSNGAAFTVLEGPICAGIGPLTWYRVDYGNGVTGWSSESQLNSAWGSQYWLAPVQTGS